MKQKLLLLFAFLATMITGARATVVSIVGSSGGYNYLSPTVMNKNYSLVQQIYTAEEIGMVGTITHVFYYYWNSEGSGFSKEGVQLFMKQVDKAKFSSDTDMVDLTEADKVFEGTFAGTETGWIQITLDKAFEFDGNSNLLVAFYDPTEGSFGTSNMFYYTSTSNYMVLDYYDDALCPDLSDLSSYQGTKKRYTYRNAIAFNIEGTSTIPEDVILYEGFGSGGELTFPSGSYYGTQEVWSNMNSSSSSSYWKQVTSAADGLRPHSGGMFAHVNRSGSQLAVPTLDLRSCEAATLRFFYANPKKGDNASEFVVYCRPIISGSSTTFEQIYETAEAHDDWTEVVISLPKRYFQYDFQIIFSCTTGGSDYYGVALDDVTIDNKPIPFPDNSVYDQALNVEGGTLSFVAGGDYPWVVVSEDGRTYAKSDNYEKRHSATTLSTEVEVTVPSVLSFDYQLTGGGYIKIGWNKTSLQNTNGWSSYSASLSPGTYTLTWEAYEDYPPLIFAIDNVKLTATPSADDGFFDDFEGEPGWDMSSFYNNIVNNWVIGSAVNNGGSKSLYISNDGGVTNAYSNYRSYVYATKYLNFKGGDYPFSFDWRCKGEYSDRVDVYLVPDSYTIGYENSIPSSAIKINYGVDLGNTSSEETYEASWTHFSKTVNVPEGIYQVVFCWENDNSNTFDPPAAIDNFRIGEEPFTPTQHDAEEATACDSYTWNGTQYTTSGTYTYEAKNDEGQVTDIYTLNLTIHQSTSETKDVTVYLGQHYTDEDYPGAFDFDVTAETPTTMHYTSTNTAGCDHVVTLNLTIIDPGIPIDEVHFPDENFRNYIKEGSYFDKETSSYLLVNTNRDDYLSTDEAAATALMFNGKNVSNTKGIEYFTQLKQINCYGNQLAGTAVDELIAALPVRSEGDGIIYFEEAGYERVNRITAAQIEAAKAKGWTVMMEAMGKWVESIGLLLPLYFEWQSGEDTWDNLYLSEENFASFKELLQAKGRTAEGSLTYDKESHTLTMNGLKTNTSLQNDHQVYDRYYYEKDPVACTIVVKGENELAGFRNYYEKEVNIVGEGTLKSSSTVSFYANKVNYDGPTLEVNATGDEYTHALRVDGNEEVNTTINSGTLRLTATGSPLVVSVYHGTATLTLGERVKVVEPEGAIQTNWGEGNDYAIVFADAENNRLTNTTLVIETEPDPEIVIEVPAEITAPIILTPVDYTTQPTNLNEVLDEKLKQSPNPAYISIELAAGESYVVTKPLTTGTSLTLMGDASDPAIIDASALEGPLVQMNNRHPRSGANNYGFFETNTINIKNILIEGLEDGLFSVNKTPYIVNYLNVENVQASVAEGKTVFDFEGGLMEQMDVTKSTLYVPTALSSGTPRRTAAFTGATLYKATVNPDDAYLPEQKFTVSHSTLSRVMGLQHAEGTDKTILNIDFNNNIIIDAPGFTDALGGGQRTLVNYNTFVTSDGTNYTADEEENPLASGNYTEDVIFAGNPAEGDFTLDDCEAKSKQIGDPRWVMETTDINNVQWSSLNGKSDTWYTLDGRRLQGKPTKKGLYIRNNRKTLVY